MTKGDCRVIGRILLLGGKERYPTLRCLRQRGAGLSPKLVHFWLWLETGCWGSCRQNTDSPQPLCSGC